AWRDTRVLVREFRGSLLAFAGMLLGGGALYYTLAQNAGEPLPSLAESVYHILGLVFLQPIEPFPRAWYLQIFFFLAPLAGLSILAQGIADFGVMLFNRRARGKTWEVAVASLFKNHIVLVGLGHLGFRVLQTLTEMGNEVVVIERAPNPDLAARVRARGIPIIEGDATRQMTLQEAGVARARAIVVCIQEDSVSLQIAVKARSLNPDIAVTVRIFDDDFAADLSQQFGFHAMSATGMAAPAFAAAAAGMDMTRPITVEGQSLSLARLKVTAGSPLDDMRIGEVESRYHVSVVLLRRDTESTLHPPSEKHLAPGDTLAVLGGPAEISRLHQDNHG
ncbi:MAG: hypothetical protein D6755_07120, partial [Anaerolineae bacterium]